MRAAGAAGATPAGDGSPAVGVGVDIDGIERRLRRDVEAVPLWAAEGDVGDALAYRDATDQRAVRRIDRHAIAGRGPDIALPVDTEPVIDAGLQCCEHALEADRALVRLHRIGHDLARMVRLVRDAGVGHVEQALIRRESEAVRPHHVGDDRRHLPRHRLDAVDVRGTDLGLRRMTLVMAVDAVGRIGEPDAAVPLLHDIVGRVEALALETIGQRRPGSVMLKPRDAAATMLAGDHAAEVVQRMAVVVAARVFEDADGAIRFVKAHDTVAGDVRPEETLGGGHIDGAFGPAQASVKLLQLRVGDDQPVEARIKNLIGQIYILSS